MKILKQILVLLLLLQLHAMATESLKKSDPEVIALCDKNGDKKIKGKDEGLCYLDLKKKNLNQKSAKLDEESVKLDEESVKLDEEIRKIRDDRKKLQKIKELLGNK